MDYLDKLFILRDVYEKFGWMEAVDEIEEDIKRHMEA